MADINKYLEHSVSAKLVQTYLRRSKTPVMELPVCPKCEAVALRTKGWAEKRIVKCPRCGYEGPTTIKLSAYLKQGCYK